MSRVQVSKFRLVSMLAAVGLAFFAWGFVLSLLPPFYPQEAEKKGATPSQYGFVFGSVNLAAFLSAPLIGRYGHIIGLKALYNSGAFMQTVCSVSFGLLIYVNDVTLFVGLSYCLRALSGISDVAAWTATVSILIKLFPDHVPRIASFTETFFGLGYMFGPWIGLALYSAGGFLLPFLSSGAISGLAATALLLLIPDVKSGGKSNKEPESLEVNGNAVKHLDFKALLKHPSIMIPLLDSTICLTGNGLVALMEPHLSECGATPEQVGLAFFIYGAGAAVGSPVVGLVTDRVRHPVAVSLWGNCMMVISLALFGPLPFVPVNATVPLLTAVMGTFSVGIEFVLVSSLVRVQRATEDLGFVQDVDTYLFTSGMWLSTFYFGNFIGPTLAGILVDSWGYANSTAVFWCFYILMAVMDTAVLSWQLKAHAKEYTRLENN